MAIINSYPLATPKLTDLVLGTSTSSTGQTSTKSFTVQSIRDATSGVKTIITATPTTLAITGTADVTINTITAAVTDGGEALTTGNDVYDFVVGKITGTPDTVPIWTNATTLGNSLISQANNSVIINGSGTDGRIQLNCSATTHGVGIQSPPHSAGATYDWILPQVAGTAGQVLTSGGGATDQLTWSDNGNVGGTGTQNKLSKWSNATTLADSNIEDTGSLVTISGATKVTGNLELDADLLDVNGGTGTAGQLLSSLGTGNGIDWVDAPVTGVVTVTSADANVITVGGTSTNPTIDANTGAVSAGSNNLATGGQIQTAINAALAGTLTFKGTFNASTGAITSGSNSGSQLYTGSSGGVAISQGDFYIADTSGAFFGGTTIGVGDEAIALNTVGSGSSSASDFSVVPAQTAGGTVTTFSTVSTAYPGITTTVTNPTTTPELTLGLGTNAAAGKYLDGGTGDWVTLPAGDTYTLQAGAKAGSSVPLQLDAAAGSDSTVNLTEGTGITLTQTSSSEITIDAAGGGGGTKTVSTVASVGAGVSTHALGISVTTTPTVNYVDLYISGVYQSKTSYTVSGSTLTLTGTTFPTGALIETVTTT